MIDLYDEMLQIERERQEEAWGTDGEMDAMKRSAEREWALEVAGEYGWEAQYPVVQVTVTPIQDDDVPF